jgi:hypothetical protein
MPCDIRYILIKNGVLQTNHASICVFTVLTDNFTLRMFNNNEKITTNENNYSMDNNQ